MGDVIPGSLVPDLLSADLRGELCIADIALGEDGRMLRFRMDPGRAFERRGTIADAGGGWYLVSVADRHRPGDPPSAVSATYGMTAEDVPDELRGAAGRAWTRAAARPHWRDALSGTAPKMLAAWPDATVTPAMTAATADTAREIGGTCFFCWRDGQPRCVTVPPRDAATFLSVTPEGAWSLHCGTETYPVSGHPDTRTFAAIRPDGSVEPRRLQPVRAARLARRDVPGAGPPTVTPARRGPARTGDQDKHARGRRRGR